eukprot:SAG31_NODE_1458_length_8257_cov_10.274209_3_plen_389_part_00
MHIKGATGIAQQLQHLSEVQASGLKLQNENGYIGLKDISQALLFVLLKHSLQFRKNVSGTKLPLHSVPRFFFFFLPVFCRDCRRLLISFSGYAIAKPLKLQAAVHQVWQLILDRVSTTKSAISAPAIGSDPHSFWSESMKVQSDAEMQRWLAEMAKRSGQHIRDALTVFSSLKLQLVLLSSKSLTRNAKKETFVAVDSAKFLGVDNLARATNSASGASMPPTPGQLTAEQQYQIAEQSRARAQARAAAEAEAAAAAVTQAVRAAAADRAAEYMPAMTPAVYHKDQIVSCPRCSIRFKAPQACHSLICPECMVPIEEPPVYQQHQQQQQQQQQQQHLVQQPLPPTQQPRGDIQHLINGTYRSSPTDAIRTDHSKQQALCADSTSQASPV